MVIYTLTPELINQGIQLLHELDKGHVDVDAAFWQQRQEDKTWCLAFSFSDVEITGARPAYSRLQKALAKLSLTELRLEDMVVLRPKDPMLATLRRMFATGTTIVGIRVSSNVVNGVLIPDMHIYRMLRVRKGHGGSSSSSSSSSGPQ